MKPLTLICFLLAAVAAPVAAAEIQIPKPAQEASAPEGAVIESAELSGLSMNQLSPGLRREIEALAGTPLSARRLEELVARIEAERLDVVAASRSVARPDGKARVIFLVARISEDKGLRADINARYIVESAAIEGVRASQISQALQDEVHALAGSRLDPDKADDLSRRISDELHGRAVHRRLNRRKHNTFIASGSFGRITGSAPLFERFTLGDSTFLRGWNKYDRRSKTRSGTLQRPLDASASSGHTCTSDSRRWE